MRVSWIAAPLIASLALPAAAADKEPFIFVHTFIISEGGGFLDKTLKESGTKEMVAAVAAVCAAAGGECSTQAAEGAALAKWLSKDLSDARSYHFITTGAVKHGSDSEEWAGQFYAPAGYEVCTAGIDTNNMSIDFESTFNVTKENFKANGVDKSVLGFYAVVPKHRPEGHSIKARFAILYTPFGFKNSEVHCYNSGTQFWQCKGACQVVVRRIVDVLQDKPRIEGSSNDKVPIFKAPWSE
jgi:hypothetical protein